jgi:hypothetical protein
MGYGLVEGIVQFLCEKHQYHGMAKLIDSVLDMVLCKRKETKNSDCLQGIEHVVLFLCTLNSYAPVWLLSELQKVKPIDFSTQGYIKENTNLQ